MARKRGGLSLGLLLPRIVASPAPSRFCASLCFANKSVPLVKRMALGAVGFYTVMHAGIPAPNVFLLRNGFQVARVEASSVSAQVVYVQAFGHRPVHQLV